MEYSVAGYDMNLTFALSVGSVRVRTRPEALPLLFYLPNET